MSLTLTKFDDLPGEIGVTKIGKIVPGGRFLLDYSRPLEFVRWFGTRNRFIGPKVAVLTPVIHETESAGELLISVARGDVYFDDIVGLWELHNGKRRASPSKPSSGLKVAADFAVQFPEDS